MRVDFTGSRIQYTARNLRINLTRSRVEGPTRSLRVNLACSRIERSCRARRRSLRAWRLNRGFAGKGHPEDKEKEDATGNAQSNCLMQRSHEMYAPFQQAIA